MNTASNIGIQLTLKGAEQVKQGLKTISGSAAEMARQFEASRGAILTTAAAVATATGIMVDRVSTAAAEIERFAMLAGSTPQEFQRMAAGAKSAGMDMEKYASVMKDVQDKIGQFLQSEGGELKDFFEKIAPAVGVTAEQFRHLSGPQALQLFYNSLEKANLSQSEMVSWMEAIADDATALAPLLRDNGAAFDALADRAAKYGAVLSDYALAASKDFKGQTDEMTLALQGAEQLLAVGLMPTLTETARELLATADSAGIADTAATVIRTTLEALVVVASDVAFTFTAVGREIGGLAAQAQAFLSLDFARAGQIGAMMKQDAATARAELEAFQQRLLNAGQTAKDVFNLSGVMKGNKTGTAEYQAALNALIRMKDDGTLSASQYTAAIKGATAASGALGNAETRTANAAAVAQQRIREEFKSTAEKRNEALDKARKAFGGMIPPDIEKQIREKFKEPLSDSAKAVASSAKSVQQAYQTAFESAEKQARDLVSEEKNLNSAEKALADVMAGEHWGKWNEAQRKAIELIYQRNAATIARQKQEEADAKWASESADANANVAESAYEAANAAEAQRDAQLQANAAIGLTALEVVNLEASRIDDTAAEKQRLAAIMEGIDPTIAADYRRQAQALTELADAKRDGAVKDAMVESAKEAADEWKRTADKIEDALIDALMDGGKSGAEYIEGLFRSMVLRPVIQAIVSPVAGAVTSAMGLPGAPAAGGGLMGMANTASSLNNLYNIGASAANWLGLGTATATGLGLSAAMGTGTALAATGTGLGLSAGLGAGYGFAAGGGLGLTAASAGAGTIGAGLGTSAAVTGSTAAAGGAMSTVGAAMPWVAGALAIDQLLLGGKVTSGISKILGIGGDGKPRHVYQTGGGDFEDKVSVAGVYGDIGMHDNGSKNIKAADFTETFQAIADLDATIAATLSPDQNAQIKAALDNYVSGKNESTADYMADRMKIMADVIGGGVNELVDQFGGTSEELVNYLLRLTQAQPTIDALAFLGKSLGDTEAATLSAALAMENLVGGQQNLLALTGSYYAEFYTEAERTAHATQALTEALASIGVDTMPATRDAFRDLVEAQDLTTESGRATYAGLLGVSDAFAALVPATEAAANAVETIEQAYQSLTNVTLTAEQAAQQRIGMEDRLLTLQGNTAALRARELAALDPTNRALQESIWALEDLQAEATAMEQAVQDAITAQQDYAAAVQSAQDALTSAQNALAQATDAVTSVQNQATSAYLNAKDREAAAIQKIADLQTQTQRDLADAARKSNQELQDMADTLRDFVFGEMKDPSLQFGDALAKALAGDKAAMASLPDLARSATEAATLQAGSAVEARRAQAEIMRGVLDAAAVAETAIAVVPDAPGQEDPLVAAQRELTAAQTEVADALRVANAIQAPLTQSIEDLIAAYKTAKADEAAAAAEVQAAQAALDAIKTHTWETWQATKALDLEIEKMHVRAQLNVDAIVDTVINAELPPELAVLALGSKDALQKTIDATITSSDLTPELKLLALESTDEITKVVAASIETRGELGDDVYKFLNLQATDLSKVLTTVLENSGNLSTDVIEFVSWTASDVSKTLTAAIANKGILGADAVTLIGLASDGITKTLQAAITNSGSLSDDAKTLIAGSSANLARTLAVTISNPTTDKNVAALLATTTSAISRTIETTINQAGAAPTDITNLKLGTAEALTKNISTVLTNPVYASDVPEAMKQLLAAENIAKNLLPKISTDNLTADEVSLLNSIVSSTTKDINLAGSVSMSTGLESLLGGILEYSKQTSDNTALQYFAANPDVAKAYSQNTYGKTIGEFAKYHYQNYGINEGRLWGGSGATSTSTGTIAAPPPTPPAPPVVVTPPAPPVAAYDKSKVLDSREFLIDYALSRSGFTASGYLSKNPDVASGWDGLTWEHKDSFGGMKDLYAAWHYGAYGQAQQRLFANGGYTGPGGKYEPAGIVHAGEVVWSQADVERWGGWQSVDAMRRQAPQVQAAPQYVRASMAGSDPVVAELRALRSQVSKMESELNGLRHEARATAVHTGRTSDLMKRVTRNGEAMQTEAFA